MSMSMRAALLIGMMGVASVAWAQGPIATPLHRLAWDQTDPTGLSYEITIDGAPLAPVLSVSCGPSTCSGALPVSLQPGTRVARLRAYRVTDGIRQNSALSPDFSFVFVGDPTAPGNLRLEAPSTPQQVVAVGDVGAVYGQYGLRIAPITLPAFGAQILVGGLSLTAPAYGEPQAGDKAAVVFWRP